MSVSARDSAAPSPLVTVFGIHKSPAWGCWGCGGTNERLIRLEGCRKRGGWGYTPAPPFPRQNLGLSCLTCPPKGAEGVLTGAAVPRLWTPSIPGLAGKLLGSAGAPLETNMEVGAV